VENGSEEGERKRFSIFVPDEPVPKGRPRISTSTGYVYTPSRTQQSEWRIRQLAQAEWSDPLEVALELRLVVSLQTPQMPKKWIGIRQATKRPDLDNYIKTVLDALNGIVYLDDSQVVKISAQKVYGYGDLQTGWYIQVIPIPDLSPMARRHR